MKIQATFLFLLYPLLASLQPKCDAISTGYIPINDLGTEISPLTGKMGGLYLNGSNDMPAEHLKFNVWTYREIRMQPMEKSYGSV